MESSNKKWIILAVVTLSAFITNVDATIVVVGLPRLMAGLGILGLEAELARAGHTEGSSPACFDAPATSELTVGGRKVIGSAQVRRSGDLLQYGSVPRRFDAALHVRLLGLHGGQAAERWLQRRAAGLSDAAGRDLAWDEVAEALIEGWRRALEIGMVPGRASAREAEREPDDQEVPALFLAAGGRNPLQVKGIGGAHAHRHDLQGVDSIRDTIDAARNRLAVTVGQERADPALMHPGNRVDVQPGFAFAAGQGPVVPRPEFEPPPVVPCPND